MFIYRICAVSWIPKKKKRKKKKTHTSIGNDLHSKHMADVCERMCAMLMMIHVRLLMFQRLASIEYSGFSLSLSMFLSPSILLSSLLSLSLLLFFTSQHNISVVPLWNLFRWIYQLHQTHTFLGKWIFHPADYIYIYTDTYCATRSNNDHIDDDNDDDVEDGHGGGGGGGVNKPIRLNFNINMIGPRARSRVYFFPILFITK